MGRHCGWLTAATALDYRKRLGKMTFIPEVGVVKEKWDVHSVLLPEEEIDFDKECARLNKIMDQYDCVNVFLCEGAGLDTIVKETEKVSLSFEALASILSGMIAVFFYSVLAAFISLELIVILKFSVLLKVKVQQCIRSPRSSYHRVHIRVSSL